jgi:hypothetical protein
VGKLLYTGIGGHREADEGWLARAHREAQEVIGTDVDILSAPPTWHIPRRAPARPVNVSDLPHPQTLDETIHPLDTLRAGGVHRFGVYQAQLLSPSGNLLEREVLTTSALTEDQVIRWPRRRSTLAELCDEGAQIVVSTRQMDQHTRLSPLGTASALAYVVGRVLPQPGQLASNRTLELLDSVRRESLLLKLRLWSALSLEIGCPEAHRRYLMAATSEFWSWAAACGAATWPVQAAMIFAAAFRTYPVFWRLDAGTDMGMQAFPSAAFARNGVVFFRIFEEPYLDVHQHPLSVIVSLPFALDIWTGKSRFQLAEAWWKKRLTIVRIALAFLYPLIGWPLGHRYLQVLLPVFPCQLTVLTIALVAAAAPRVDKKVLALLLPWGPTGLLKCFGALDCCEDCILFTSRVHGLVEPIWNWVPRAHGDKEQELTRYEKAGAR